MIVPRNGTVRRASGYAANAAITMVMTIVLSARTVLTIIEPFQRGSPKRKPYQSKFNARLSCGGATVIALSGWTLAIAIHTIGARSQMNRRAVPNHITALATPSGIRARL